MTAHDELNIRVDALASAVEVADGRLDVDRVTPARALVDRVRGRLRHGTTHTVIALAGPTGAGKSTLFNALAGTDISSTGVRRPTTSSTHAVIWGEGASALLDWLEIERRHQAPDTGPSGDTAELDGLVLLDLPDFDSTERTHQMEVDRLIELVDLLIWVVDPQKYADQSLHEQYLRPLRSHSEVMRFVLNKADTLANPAEVVADYEARLAEDGISNAQVLAVSATSGDGIAAASSLLRSLVAERKAAVARLDADLKSAADELGSGSIDPATGSLRDDDVLTKAERVDLIEGFGRAAGVDSAADVVAAQYLRDGALATGWPASKWVRKIRKTPLRSLPSPAASSMATAEVGVALRDAAEAVAGRLEPGWATAVRDDMRSAQPEVLDGLAKVPLRAADAARDQPGWWSIVAWLQRLAALTAVVGALWLLAMIIGSAFFRIDTDVLTPMINDWLPLPTLLVGVGLLLGLVIALIARVPLNVGAKRRSSRVRKELHEHVASVADTTVVASLDATLADKRELRRLLEVVRGNG